MANIALSTFFNDDTKRPWTKALTGPALSLPESYKAYALSGQLHIEYLQTGSTNVGQDEAPNKNHVVFQVPFAEAHELMDGNNRVTVLGARISMDLTDDDDAIDKIDKDLLEPGFIEKAMGKDYFPGTLYVKLVKYDGKSLAANKITKFSGLAIGTLGAFVDFLERKKLHEMSFLGYRQAWKGCRHFIAQSFLQLRGENKIIDLDDEGLTLKDNINKVHHKDQGSHGKLVDRGRFLNYIAIYPDDFVDAYVA